MQLGYSHHIENKSTVKRGFDKNQMFKEKRIFEYDLPKPDVIVKPAAMVYSSCKVKLSVIIIGFILYIYFLIFIKTIHMKNKRLEQISEMAHETEREMVQLHNIDNELGNKILRLKEMLNMH